MKAMPIARRSRLGVHPVPIASPADRDLEAIAERDLWSSVFLQAIDDLTETKGPKPRAIQEAAHRWFESRSEEPRAFLWVCSHLNLDSAAVLESILHNSPVGKNAGLADGLQTT